MVNQVLLATTQYVTSCWCFSQACIKELRMSWGSIIRPPHKSGLGIIDQPCWASLLLKDLLQGGMPTVLCRRELYIIPRV